MKNLTTITILSLSMLSFSAFAQVPQELQDLIPSGKNDLRLIGFTRDNKNCSVNLSSSSFSYSASLAVKDGQGVVDSRRFGTFQIGFGHRLQSIETQGENIVATSTHEAEESYSTDSRSTLKVNNPGNDIKAVQIVIEEKGFFGFKTTVKETCIIK